MKNSNLEDIISINEKLTIEKLNFINAFENEKIEIKNQVHYQSVLNMVDGLIKIKNKRDTKEYKILLLEYFNEIKTKKFPLQKLDSMVLFNEYLFPPSKYLMGRGNFRSKADLKRLMIFGLIFDLILFLIIKKHLPFYVPFISILLIMRGYRKQKKAIKEKRFFNSNY